jgi:3-dehydrosphinganine reductase
MQSKNETITVLITGASSGIGLSLAKEYASRGCELFIIARSLDKLMNAKIEITNEFPQSTVHIFSADVSSELEIKNTIKEIKTLTPFLDIVICNAGVLQCGRFDSIIPSDSHKVFDINYWGMFYTAYYSLPLLKSKTGSSIAFVSSVAGYTGLYGYTHYAPSKFAIAGLAECLRMELKDYSIHVTVIYPPDTETPMLEYERKNTLPECMALSRGAGSISAKAAALRITNVIRKQVFECYFNYETRFIRVLKGLSPSLYFKLVDRIIQKHRRKVMY